MTFNENWYSDEQASFLASLGRSVRSLEGAVIEIGCWEGKSTCALANAVYPDVVIAVDTWKGNVNENPDHPSVHIAQTRDVLSVFKSNIDSMTKGNVEPVIVDCHDFLASYRGAIKFCHIDACHDYLSVLETIRVLLPLTVQGGLLCGDDFVNAGKSRMDLDGGVERAVRECLPGFRLYKDLWFWTSRETGEIQAEVEGQR